MEVKNLQLNWRFAGASYRWKDNVSDHRWVTELPGGERVYCWGREADPRKGEGSLKYSLVPPKEVWTEVEGRLRPQGFNLEDEEVFEDFFEVLEKLGYRIYFVP